MSDEPVIHVDNLRDLAAPVGATSEEDQRVRLVCIEQAVLATPKMDDEMRQMPEILLTARRFARFVLDGTTPGLARYEAPAEGQPE